MWLKAHIRCSDCGWWIQSSEHGTCRNCGGHLNEEPMSRLSRRVSDVYLFGGLIMAIGGTLLFAGWVLVITREVSQAIAWAMLLSPVAGGIHAALCNCLDALLVRIDVLLGRVDKHGCVPGTLKCEEARLRRERGDAYRLRDQIRFEVNHEQATCAGRDAAQAGIDALTRRILKIEERLSDIAAERILNSALILPHLINNAEDDQTASVARREIDRYVEAARRLLSTTTLREDTRAMLESVLAREDGFRGALTSKQVSRLRDFSSRRLSRLLMKVSPVADVMRPVFGTAVTSSPYEPERWHPPEDLVEAEDLLEAESARLRLERQFAESIEGIA